MEEQIIKITDTKIGIKENLCKYEYKVINGDVEIANSKVKRFSDAVEVIINNVCSDGWEFYSIYNITQRIPAGCLGILFNRPPEYTNHQCFVFRRLKQEKTNNENNNR